MIGRIYELGKIKQVILIFFIGLIARISLTILFLNKYGPHATRGELWHWYALGKGLVWLSPQDITKYMLEFAAGFFPGHIGVYAVMFLGMFLSSATAVLLYLLVSEFHDKKTAFVSAVSYTLLIETLFSSTATFLHDLVQLPLMILLILLVVYAVREKKLIRGALYAASAIVLIYFGLKVSQTFYLVFGALLVYLLSIYLLKYFSKNKKSEEKTYAAFFVLLTLSSVVFTFTLAPKIIDQVFGSFAQGRYGSTDNLPMTADFLWGRIGLAAFFIPAGVYVIYKKRDMVSYTILLSGFLTASLVSRASRYALIGYAVLLGCAAASWKKEWGKKAAAAYIVLLAAFLFYTFPNITPLSETFVASIIFAAAFLFLSAKNKDPATTFLFIFVTLSLVLGFFVCVERNNLGEMTTEDEYMALNYLMENKTAGGKILISWDRGDMGYAVSGLKPVSDFARINRTVHRFLWLPEDEAAEKLANANVSYVVLTNRDFTSYAEGDRVYFQSGGLAFETPENLTFGEIKETALYKMRYQPQELRNFKPAYISVNKEAGILVLIYKLELSQT